MASFDVVIPLMQRAREEVRDAHERLTTERDEVGRVVEALLAGGWSGASATAYGAAWQDWLAGAAEVLAGLDDMGAAIGAARADYETRDTSNASGLARAGVGIGDHAAGARPSGGPTLNMS